MGLFLTHRVWVNSVLLISSVLSMNTLWESNSANHLPHLTFLPTFTSTAWYHKCLGADLQALPLRKLRKYPHSPPRLVLYSSI